MERPTNTKELQRFLGLYTFYRRHIREFADGMNPLYTAQKLFVWGGEQERSWQAAREKLKAVMELKPLSNDPHFTIYTDASAEAVGAVIYQDMQPVACFSALLRGAERNYSKYEREALAVVKVLRKY